MCKAMISGFVGAYKMISELEDIGFMSMTKDENGDILMMFSLNYKGTALIKTIK
jgi:hypothetical protein